jgi:hypothetical protein
MDELVLLIYLEHRLDLDFEKGKNLFLFLKYIQLLIEKIYKLKNSE